MKPDSPYDSSDQEPILDDFFRMQDLAPADFATRTLAAVRAGRRRRRARIFQIGGWTTALAASLALLVGLTLSRPTAEPEMAGADAAPAVEIAAAVDTDPREAAPSPVRGQSAQDLNDLLYAALSETDQLLHYGHASELEVLLEEAIALADDESLYTLDMLILLAGN